MSSDNILILRQSSSDAAALGIETSFTAKRKRDALKQARADIAKLNEPGKYTVVMVLEEFAATSGLVVAPTRPSAPRKPRAKRVPAEAGATP